MSNPIAVIDSGVGGLTVAQELLRQLPREEICYFGDTARCPYGQRSIEEVRTFSFQMIDYLMESNPKMLVIACNTATAVILEECREKLDIPVIGVIHPGVRTAIKATVTGRVGVIGTQNTVQSGLYEEALKQIHPALYVKSLACPTLVPLAEKGGGEETEAIQIVKKALAPLAGEDIDTLILGCTHYPLLSNVIQRVIGDQVQMISSADETAREVSTILFHKNLLSQQFGRPMHRFYTSGNVSVFQQIAERWLNKHINVKQVILDS
nr:glutamate racemase [Caldalkalibacillus salinus]